MLAKKVSRAAAADQEKVDVQLKAGENEIMLKVVNGGGGYGFFFALDASGTSIPADVTTIAKIDPAERNDKQGAKIRDFYRNSVSEDPTLAKLREELNAAQTEKNEVENAIPTTLVFRERKDLKPAFMLERGEYDQKGEQVARATPAFLPPMDPKLPRDRFGLAKWTVDPANPLVARVAVNRFWQQLFGTGIVKTAEDLGTQGEWPSHPQLLDYLAVDFVDSGWDIKAFMKKLVMSATYRQSSRANDTKIEKDPNNRLLARGPRYRLDAEMLRDQALAISGLLVNKLGGPSVKPPQPDGLWFAVGYSGSNTVRFKKDAGADKIYRRSVYTFWKRTAPPPQMGTFDAPSRESCTVRRERTNTPLQALLLMNDPQYIEAARVLAQRVMREAAAPAGRATRMFHLATAREPSASELDILLNAYKDHAATYKADVDAATKLITVGESAPDEKLDVAVLAAWTMVANLVLNMDEVVSKN